MILVTGANGQLGSCLINELKHAGIEYSATSRESLDISNFENINDYFLGKKFSIIINAAAWTAVDDAEDQYQEALNTNYVGVRNLATIAVQNNARLIHVSTDYVFHGDATSPYTTDSPTNPINAYGRSKLLGEEAVLNIGSGRFPIVRTAWLYSRFGKNFAKTMTSRALKGQHVKVVHDQLGQPTSASDLAKFIVSLTNVTPVPSILHGTNSGQCTWFDFAKEIYSLLNVDTSLVSAVPSTEYPTKAERPTFSVLDHSELKGSSVAEMRNWREALSDEISAIREQVQGELQ